MARILVVDDDQPVLDLIHDLLTGMGHEVALFPAAEPALADLHENPADLIVSDISLPVLNGFEFRDQIKAEPQLSGIPFIFLTGADESVEGELSKRMAEEVVMFKPLNVPSFRRLVDSMLGELPTEEGRLTPSVLQRAFERVQSKKANAVLSVYSGEHAKKILFENGRLVFAIGNKPSEFVGQALIREGLISERGLARLFEARGDRKIPLGEVFIAELGGKGDVLEEVLVKKIQDAVLDLFLWEGGTYTIYYGGVESAEIPFKADVSTDDIVSEGMRRAEVWSKVCKLLPGDDARFQPIGAGIPADEKRSPGDHLLARLIDDGVSLGQLKLELRGQIYAVGVKVAKWLRAGFIQPAAGKPRRPSPSGVFKEPVNAQVSSQSTEDVAEFDELSGKITVPGDEPAEGDGIAVAPILAKALVHLRDGETEEARVALLQVLELDPANPLARKRLAEIDDRYAADARGSGLAMNRQVMLVKDLPDDMDVHPSEAFVYSRLAAEPLTVEALTQVCPLSEAEILRVLMRFVAHGIVKVV